MPLVSRSGYDRAPENGSRGMQGLKENEARRKWIVRVVWSANAVALLIFVSLFVRSDAVLRAPIERELGAIGEALHGHFEIESVRPSGLAGVSIHGVSFYPDDADIDVPVVRVERISVRPRLASLIEGDIELGTVIVRDPAVVFIADSSGGGHIPWAESFSEHLRSSTSETAAGESPLERGGIRAIEVEGGHVSVEDPGGTYPPIGVRIESLRVRPEELTSLARQGVDTSRPGFSVDGLVTVEGLGRGMVFGIFGGDREPGLSLRMLQDNNLFTLLPERWRPSRDAEMSVGSIDVEWPPRVTVTPVSARQMNLRVPLLETWRLDDVWTDDVSVVLDSSGYALELDDVRMRFSGLLDETDVRLGSGRVFRGWDGEQAYAELELVDDNGGTLGMRFDQVASDEMVTLRMEGDGYALNSVLAVLPEWLPATFHAGEIAGEVLLEWMPGSERLTGYVNASFRDVGMVSPVLSSEPLEDFDLDVDLRLAAWSAEQRIRISDATLRVGDAPIHGEFDLTLTDDRMLVDLEAHLAPIDAQDALNSLPRGLAPALEGFVLGGEFGFDAHLHLDSEDVEATVAEVDFHVETLDVLVFGSHARIDLMMTDDFVQTVSTFEGGTRDVGPGTSDWTDLRAIPYHVHRAILAAEDDRFWVHGGFDERGIQRALRVNLTERRFAQGGSTISQQVVKNLFLSHDRTVGRKLQELFLTWQMEENVSKWRILETYVNLVHWGPGIYGLADASDSYFAHPPREMTLRESAFLASILPNPNLFGQQYSRSIIPPSRRTKMRNILANMHRAGFIGDVRFEHQSRLVERGLVSATPPPRQLGTFIAQIASADTVADNAMDDTLLFLP